MRPAASAAVELAGPASARGEGDEARRGREEEQSADAVALSEAVAEEVGFGADDTVDVSANSGGSASGGSFAAAAAVTPSSGGHARRSSGSASLPGSDGGPESAEASRASDVDGIALAWGSGLRSVLVALAMVAPRPRGAADGGPTIGDALRYGLFAVGRLVMLGNFLWRVAWALAVTDYEHELERYAWVMIISAPFSLFLGFVFARPDVLLAAPAREFALRKDVARAYLTTISRATTVSLVCFASLIIGLINAAHWGPLARGEPPSGMTSSLEMRAFERFGAAWTLLFIVSNSVFVVAAFQGGMYFIYHMLLLMYALRCLRRRATALQGAEGCESVAASYAAVAHAIIRFRRTFLVPFVCSCVLAVGSQLLYLVLFAQQSGRYPSFAALSIPATGFVNLFTNAAVAYKLVRYQLVARRAIASRIAALMRKEQWAASSELAPHSARLVAQLARPSPVEKIILGDAPLQALARITTRRLTLEQRHRVAWLPIHARLLLEAFGAISPSLFVLMAVRAMAQNPPRCVTFDGKRLVSDCSLRVNALRAWERVTLGFYFNLSTIFTLAALITGWPLVRAQLRRFLWMPPAAYLLLMAAAYPLAVLAEDDLDPVPAITFYCVSLLFLLCTRHYIAQLRGSASIANRLAFGGVSIIALHGFLSLFILPLFVGEARVRAAGHARFARARALRRLSLSLAFSLPLSRSRQRIDAPRGRLHLLSAHPRGL
jgi:hypothetical protein